MNLLLSAEQEQLRETVRRFLTATLPLPGVREIVEAGRGHDRGIWRRMSRELGLTGLLVPGRHGGSGPATAAMAVVLEELGASLLPTPFWSSAVYAAAALTRLDHDPVAAELLAGIASGEVIAALARTGAGDARITADGRGRLRGRVPFVVDGVAADVVLVVADPGGGPRLYAVDGDAGGLSRDRLRTLDLTREVARIELDQVAARPVGSTDPAPALRAAWDHAAVGLAAEQLGLARRCLKMTIGHARTRVQFGRPIGSFQAVKHGLADLYAGCELAESAVRHAAWTADERPAELPVAAALALASAVGFEAADQAIHFHGGIGFTWEHDLHLYYRRAKTSQHLLGNAAHHLDRLAQRLPAVPPRGEVRHDLTGPGRRGAG